PRLSALRRFLDWQQRDAGTGRGWDSRPPMPRARAGGLGWEVTSSEQQVFGTRNQILPPFAFARDVPIQRTMFHVRFIRITRSCEISICTKNAQSRKKRAGSCASAWAANCSILPQSDV